MNKSVKLLFDECLGRPLVEDIKKLLSWDDPPPTIGHILDYFSSGTCDSVWIPKVAAEEWIILTSDRGKKSAVKLPAICNTYGITHILMGPSVLHLKQNQKANIIVALWDDIKRCAEAPKGTRFHLRLSPSLKPTITQAKAASS